MKPITRRNFLYLAAVGGSGLGLMSLSGCERAEWTPAQTKRFLPLVTPVRDAYVLTQNPVPVQNVDPYVLSIRGACRNPYQITLDELTAQKNHRCLSYLSTMVCAFDTPDQDLSYTGVFGGISLKSLIDRADPESSVNRVTLMGVDGFQSSLPMAALVNPIHELPPLLALTHNGEALTHDHGRPMRAVVPGLYGYKSVKYLKEIVLTTDSQPVGQFESMFATHPDRPIAGGSKIRHPLDTARISPGLIQVTGYALPGPNPTRGVDIQIDDGPWQSARLTPLEPLLQQMPLPDLVQLESDQTYPFPGVWAPWTYHWQGTPGGHVLRARMSTMPDWQARDLSGETDRPWVDEVEIQVG